MIVNSLYDANTGQVLIASLQITTSSWERMKGLLATQELSPDTALLIMPCNSVHTFFMNYSIDVIYLDKQAKIKKIVSQLKPWRLSMSLASTTTLELASGMAEKLNLTLGQQLKWTNE